MPLFFDIGFHYRKAAHREILGGGDRKEGEGGKGREALNRRGGKRNPQRSKVNDS